MAGKQRDFRLSDHLPNLRPDHKPPSPDELPRQRNGVTPQMHGRYPDYNVLDEAGHWDEVTRRLVLERVEQLPPIRFFTHDEALTLGVFCDVVMAQDREPKIPVLNMVDAKLFAGELDGFRYADMPDDRETWRRLALGLDAAARGRGADDFAGASEDMQTQVVDALAKGKLHGEVWDRAPARQDLEGRLPRDPERVLFASLGVERDRVRRSGLPARLRPAGCRPARELGGRAGVRARSRQGHRAARSTGT